MLWRLLERGLLPGDVAVFVEHIYKCFVSTVLGEKACDVVQSRGASAELRDRRPTPYWTGQLNEGFMFGELRVLLFVLVVCMGVWEWLCE